MSPLTDSPFAALTTVVAPAILTNATSVLCLGTANRLARVVDRTRIVAAQLRGRADGREDAPNDRQLVHLERRSRLLLKGLRLFYTSLASFAAAALISVFGSLPWVSGRPAAIGTVIVLGLASGTIGVVGLMWGCVLMVHETRLAVHSLAEEADSLRGTRR
jgi:uncharacterized protein DUF2721